MQPPTPIEQQYPRVRLVISAITKWWRKRASIGEDAKFSACYGAEYERIAREMGMSGAELRMVVSRGEDSVDLLPTRMATVGLDPSVVSHEDGATMRDLQRTCSLCDHKKRCKRDLMRHPRAARWMKYCPNALTLRALRRQPRRLHWL